MAHLATNSAGPIEDGSGRALAYGYMYVPDDALDEDVRRDEIAVRARAAMDDLHLVTIVVETRYGFGAALDGLRRELVRRSARHVIVPSVSHFGESHLLQSMMITRLGDDAIDLIELAPCLR